jgi:hypothetical protein
MYGGVEVCLHTLLTLILRGGEWSGRWVGARAGLDNEEKREISVPTWNLTSFHGRPARSLHTVLKEISEKRTEEKIHNSETNIVSMIT